MKKCQSLVDFDLFWKAYPRKKSKGQARRTWQKLKKTKILPELDVLLAAIIAAKESKGWKKDGGDYIPHPSTWLNAEGLDDEYVVETKIKKPKICFICKHKAEEEIHTAQGLQYICKDCFALLKAAPPFRHPKSKKIIQKSGLFLTNLENMVLQQKAKDKK